MGDFVFLVCTILIDCDWLISIHTNHSSNMKRNRDRQCDAQNDTRATHFNRTSIFFSLLPYTPHKHTCAEHWMAPISINIACFTHQFASHWWCLYDWHLDTVKHAIFALEGSQRSVWVRCACTFCSLNRMVNTGSSVRGSHWRWFAIRCSKIIRFCFVWIVAFLPEFISCLFA